MLQMKIVLYTNVLVSGVLKPHSIPGSILNAILDERMTVLTDDRILFEYRDVLERPKFDFPPSYIESVLEFFEHRGLPGHGQSFVRHLATPNVLKTAFEECPYKISFRRGRGMAAFRLETGKTPAEGAVFWNSTCNTHECLAGVGDHRGARCSTPPAMTALL